MAPGITVVFQIDAAGRLARKCALPWGIGVCDLVNHAENNFEVIVFLPTALAAPEAPWSTWEATATKKTISFADPSWMKVNKLTRNKIPTKVLDLLGIGFLSWILKRTTSGRTIYSSNRP